MIVTQPLHVMFQREQASRREVAGLTHSASHHLAIAMRLRDVIAQTQQKRPGGRAEALGQTHRDGVEESSVLCRGLVACSECIEEAGTVQVQCKSLLIAYPADPRNLLDVPAASAALVDSVLDRHQTGPRKMGIFSAIDILAHLLGREAAPVAFDQSDRRA